MNNISQKAKKSSKKAAIQAAKAVQDQSIEFAKEATKQISPLPNDVVAERKHPLDVTKITEEGAITQSQEEISKQKTIDDRYLRGLEAKVAQLRKQRENEILEQKKQEEEEKLRKEQQTEQIEVAPPGGKSFKSRGAGMMGKAKKGKSAMMDKIKRKQTAEIGKMPSS